MEAYTGHEEMLELCLMDYTEGIPDKEAKLRLFSQCPRAWLPVFLDGQSQKENRKVALNAALGGVWHEERAHSAFQVGDIS
eukprot:534751-Amphidinium_carterae.3